MLKNFRSEIRTVKSGRICQNQIKETFTCNQIKLEVEKAQAGKSFSASNIVALVIPGFIIILFWIRRIAACEYDRITEKSFSSGYLFYMFAIMRFFLADYKYSFRGNFFKRNKKSLNVIALTDVRKSRSQGLPLILARFRNVL